MIITGWGYTADRARQDGVETKSATTRTSDRPWRRKCIAQRWYSSVTFRAGQGIQGDPATGSHGHGKYQRQIKDIEVEHFEIHNHVGMSIVYHRLDAAMTLGAK